MPLTLEQYATWLDGRDLPWPAPLPPEPVKAKPHVKRLDNIRAVLWNVYGTLLTIPFGELLFEHPQPFVMSMALEKTIAEFKMWASMSRKPGAPSEYMLHLYKTQLDEQRLAPSPGEKHPELQADRLWEGLVKKLFQKDYTFDAGFYGSLNEYSRKIAYFFHASLQGTAAYPGAAEALQAVAGAGLVQGVCTDGQCFTIVQLQRGFAAQDDRLRLDSLVPPDLQVFSCDAKGKKPSERLFREALDRLEKHDIGPAEVLHVASRIDRDLIPAKKLGLRTALFVGDRGSLSATPEQLKDPATKPDVLLTDLSQISEVVSG
jgi:FMN phosphatase YigB (HAD superfamily)